MQFTDVGLSSAVLQLKAMEKRLELADDYEKSILKILDALTIAKTLGVFESTAPTPALVCLRAIDAEIAALKAKRKG